MKPKIPPFVFSGISLRMLQQDDLATTLAWRNRDDARIWFKTSSTLTPDQHQAWFDAYQNKDTDYVFIIEENQTPIGQAAVYNIDRVALSAEVGRFVVAPEHRGKGHMNAGCAALIALCRDCLKLSHLYLEVLPSNHRAIRLYEHHGFLTVLRQEHLLRMERHNLMTGGANP